LPGQNLAALQWLSFHYAYFLRTLRKLLAKPPAFVPKKGAEAVAEIVIPAAN